MVAFLRWMKNWSLVWKMQNFSWIINSRIWRQAIIFLYFHNVGGIWVRRIHVKNPSHLHLVYFCDLNWTLARIYIIGMFLFCLLLLMYNTQQDSKLTELGEKNQSDNETRAGIFIFAFAFKPAMPSTRHPIQGVHKFSKNIGATSKF
jgi:hypothetical protein